MSSLDNVVKITISRSAPAVSRAGFGTALILGPNASGWSSDRIRTYTDPDDLLDDGFETSDMEYIEAKSLWSQPVTPSRFKVGRRLTPVAQVVTLTPVTTTQAVQHYIVTINGTAFDFTSDITPTAAEVVTGLIALINAGSEPVTASGTNTLILTADEAGISFVATPSSNLTSVNTTPNVGLASDLAEIAAIDSDWYGLAITSRDDDDILEAAAWIQGSAVKRIFAAASAASAIITSSTTDIGYKLKAKAYDRTFLSYSADEVHAPEAAALANALARSVGSYTLKFKTLTGIEVDALGDSAYTWAKSKNVNVYTTVAGSGMYEEGVMASGEFVDVIIGIDWIHVNMQADVFQVFRDNDKVPYTNDGTNTIVSAIGNRLLLAQKASIITDDPSYSVTAPLITDQDPANKAARKIGGIKFKAYLAGAVHSTEIDGTVLVA